MATGFMLRRAFESLSPAGARGRLSVLIFHRVLPQPDPLFPGEVDTVVFDRVCGWLAQWFSVLPLERAAALMAQGRLPARALAITFDDGYADNHDVALPILQRHGLTATFFVASGFLNGGRMWNDTVIEAVRGCTCTELDLAGTPAASLGTLTLRTVPERRRAIASLIGGAKYLAPAERSEWVAAVAERSGAALPADLMMTDAQVRALHRVGMGIGGHTVSHPILARLPADAARREIADGRDALQAIVGDRVGLFAYPNGKPGADYAPEAVDIVRRLGFDAAVSTAWGAARVGSDRYQLPRFTPWDRTRLRFALRMARNLL